VNVKRPSTVRRLESWPKLKTRKNSVNWRLKKKCVAKTKKNQYQEKRIDLKKVVGSYHRRKVVGALEKK